MRPLRGLRDIALSERASTTFDTIGWLENVASKIEAADVDPSAHQVDMSDPRQNVDTNVGTSTDQMRDAVEVLEMHFLTPDGLVVTKQDAEEIREALLTVRSIVDRVLTKAAAFSADRQEKPRSDR